MSSPFVAEIKMWGGNFAPKGYALCAGQLLPISQNTALFSLLGTTYGGDGKSTFGLPNFMDNAAVNWGQSSTGTQYFEGEQTGTPNVTLLQTEMPIHNHNIMADSQDGGDTRTPGPNFVFAVAITGNFYQTANTPLAQMAPQTLNTNGSNFPHNNMSPYLAVTFIIALQGVFPPRS